MYKWHIGVAVEMAKGRLFRNLRGQRSYKPEWVYNSGKNTGKVRNLAAHMLPTVARRHITRLLALANPRYRLLPAVWLTWFYQMIRLVCSAPVRRIPKGNAALIPLPRPIYPGLNHRGPGSYCGTGSGSYLAMRDTRHQ